jgi:hypothetical protein
MTKRIQNDLALTQTQAMERFAADAAEEIWGEPEDINYLHTVLAQCGLPYREVGVEEPYYQKRNGNATLILTRGVLLDPKTRKPVLQGLPYGAKPRLLLIHLCTQAKLKISPEVEVGDSMSALMRDLGLSVSGGTTGSIRGFKEQLNRLAATRMQLLFQDEDKVSMVNASSPIQRHDVWFPKHPNQRVLWPTTVTLSPEFYSSLMDKNAVPLKPGDIRELQQSAMALDVYTGLAHRLRRIKDDKPVPISWFALKEQFGRHYRDPYKFRQDFKETLAKVKGVYKGARVELKHNGALQLRQSAPPVSPKTIVNPR